MAENLLFAICYFAILDLLFPPPIWRAKIYQADFNGIF
jgi:hypothetical protein